MEQKSSGRQPQANKGKFELFKFYKRKTDGTYLHTFFSGQIFYLKYFKCLGEMETALYKDKHTSK